MPFERMVGVDGCRAGWFAVAIDADGTAEFGLYKSIAHLWSVFSGAGAVLIDIPIGLLSETGRGRECDRAARKVLSPLRHTSVFSPPCREALSANSYAEACDINQRACARKISIQTWGICAKIKEVDDFLQSRPETVGVLRETHPEVCFWALAGGVPMKHSKKRSEGGTERLDLLERIYPQSRALFQDALGRYLRRDLSRDDIIDTLANAVTSVLLKDGGATLPENPPPDRCGFVMEIVYAMSPTRLSFCNSSEHIKE